MTWFVLWNLDQRRYVARPGEAHSFTRDLLKARRWRTREAAEREACGNERVLPYDHDTTPYY